MLKLKLRYFGYLMRRTDSFEKTLMLGKIEGGRRRGWQRMRWLDGLTDSMDMSLSNSGSWCWTGKPGVLQSMGSQRVGHNWATELNWLTSQSLTGWVALTTTDKYFRTFQEATILRLRYWQGWFFRGLSPWLVDGCLLPLSLHGHLSVSPSYNNSRHIGLGPILVT